MRRNEACGDSVLRTFYARRSPKGAKGAKGATYTGTGTTGAQFGAQLCPRSPGFVKPLGFVKNLAPLLTTRLYSKVCKQQSENLLKGNPSRRDVGLSEIWNIGMLHSLHVKVGRCCSRDMGMPVERNNLFALTILDGIEVRGRRRLPRAALSLIF